MSRPPASIKRVSTTIRVSSSRPQARRAIAAPDPPTPITVNWSRSDTIATVCVALLALATRFIGLTSATANGTPVFDEKHYVPQAWDMVRSWFNPVLGGIESNPGYGLVVHPPLGKELLALGEMIFGYTPLGWRFMTALCGCAVVVFTMLLARRITQSWQVGLFAGLLATFDGVLLVASKFGMLDIFQVVFVVAASWTLAGDMRQVHTRFDEAFHDGRFLAAGTFGPRVGFRWWRFATGVLLGLALAVKWSGLYYIAFFGLLSVFWDLYLRKRYGARRPVVGTLIRDVPAALGSIVLVPALLYIWSWRSWFASETSVYRHAATDGTIEEDSFLHALPDAWAGWFHYHFSVLEFHSELTSSGGHSHPWDSKPWSWLVAARPILYYSSTDIECGQFTCRRMIYLFGTPAIWWLTVPVLLWAFWVWVVRRELRVILPLAAFAAGFIPWLIAIDRQMYFFYATALVPYTIVLIAISLGYLATRGSEIRQPFIQQVAGMPLRWGQLAVIIYLALVIGTFLYFSPILYGYQIPESIYQQLMWLPSWK
ncbi:dolichyl-phosphate-mannose--protein mannosyltransferase [Corynebacterium cystitidis]|uniref:dolichyl-phosphate-mannose--protein mannosyltransferase n=1 Tax=Corynebacterium cystitidis TaxID=35757 RepID=UPI00358DD66A